jgi:hypothetical protein
MEARQPPADSILVANQGTLAPPAPPHSLPVSILPLHFFPLTLTLINTHPFAVPIRKPISLWLRLLTLARKVHATPELTTSRP